MLRRIRKEKLQRARESVRSPFWQLLGDVAEAAAPVVVAAVAKKMPLKWRALLKVAKRVGVLTHHRTREAIEADLRGHGYK